MNTGILYAKMGITMFISLYTTRLILNSLGASDFGIFAIVGGAIAMLGFLNNAMAGATQRFMSYSEGAGDKEKQKSIFNISIVLHFGIALLLGVVLLIAGYFFFNGILNIPAERMYAARMVYYFMIVSTVLTVMTVSYDAVLNAHENMLYYAIVGIIESVLKLAVALIVVYTLSDKLIIYGLLMACISLLVMIIMRVYCHRKYEECVFAPKKYYDKGLMKEMAGFAGWNFLGSASSMISYHGQSLIMNFFFGTIVNASQGIAGQLNGQLSVFANSMMKALNPMLVKSEGSGNRNLMIKGVMMGSKISFFLLAFLFIPIWIEMPYILRLWLTNVPEFAVVFCRLLMIYSLINQLFIPVSSSIAAHGKIKTIQIVSSVFYFLMLIASYVLFAFGYSAYYLYIIFIIHSIISSGIILYFAWYNYKFPVSDFLKKTVFTSICSCILIFCISFIPKVILFNDSLYRLLLVTAVSTIVFFITTWWIGFNIEEKTLLKQTFNSIVSRIYKFIKR
jgi:O-antigen/teichoic acid export membrane protein